MTRFEYTFTDEDDSTDRVLLEWDSEPENLYKEIQRFKCFLLAKSYTKNQVDRLQYLDDSELAILHLNGNSLDES